jgi:hypothetical protein
VGNDRDALGAVHGVVTVGQGCPAYGVVACYIVPSSGCSSTAWLLALRRPFFDLGVTDSQRAYTWPCVTP